MAKIFSATQFFNELDLLELRLETLDPVVDYFVISESTKTHSGKDKPLYYEQNKNRYKKFHHKIIHQIVNDTPGSIGEIWEKYITTGNIYMKKVIDSDWFDKNVESFIRDTYEKEVLLRPISKQVNNKDIVLLGDLDEIPRPNKVFLLRECDFNNGEIYHFQNDMFYYYLNLQKVNENWLGVIASTAEILFSKSHCRLRTEKSGTVIPNGGWHFTYQGNKDNVKLKIESFCHQELNKDNIKEGIGYNIENAIGLGKDLYGRPAQWKVRNINDGTFPRYLVENQEKYKEYIYGNDTKS